jgi:UDP-4-amino-4,6-dideoxy-N-acetyl-beta-L-altrosamine N-acetyltransferase
MLKLVKLADRLKLQNITELSRTEQLRLLELRNQEKVRNNMYINHIIAEDEHFGWIARLKGADHTSFFAVFLDGQIIGGVSLNAISRPNKRADWTSYLDENLHGRGLGPALEFKFLDYAFFDNDFEKLNCEVLDFNTAVVSLHKRFGFVEEGFRRNHILRDGKAYGAWFLGITKPEWIDRRSALTS